MTYPLKQVVMVSGALPGSGSTLLACILGQVLLPQAARIRVDGPGPGPWPTKRTDPHNELAADSRVPDACFDPDFRIDASVTLQRARLADLLQNAAPTTGFLMDVASGDPDVLAHPPIAYALDTLTPMNRFRIEAVMLVTPDAQGMRRARGALDALWALTKNRVRATVVFNRPKGRAGAQSRLSWERMWRDWPHRGRLIEQSRLVEVRMPSLPEHLIRGHLVSKALAGETGYAGVADLDGARWRRAMASVADQFRHLRA